MFLLGTCSHLDLVHRGGHMDGEKTLWEGYNLNEALKAKWDSTLSSIRPGLLGEHTCSICLWAGYG